MKRTRCYKKELPGIQKGIVTKRNSCICDLECSCVRLEPGLTFLSIMNKTCSFYNCRVLTKHRGLSYSNLVLIIKFNTKS